LEGDGAMRNDEKPRERASELGLPSGAQGHACEGAAEDDGSRRVAVPLRLRDVQRRGILGDLL
jgi:hypothetical protein